MPKPTEIVVCGLDGVIALLEHRLPLLYNDEGEQDWERFHDACDDDMPNLPLIDRLNQARAEGIPVVLLSGRSAAVREKTIAWLGHWGIGYDALWLRPANNRKSAVEFKTAILQQHYPDSPIRRLYESEQQLGVAHWCHTNAIPYTLVGRNQGNGEGRELFDLKVIRHACDHTVVYPFYGDDDYRWEERAGQLALGACRVCQADQQVEERRKQAVQAGYHARERGLPPLEGSDRQVEWAETIRLSAFGAVDKVVKWLDQVNEQAEEEDPDYWNDVRQGIKRAIDYLECCDEAKWWIDHRHGIRNDLDSGRALLSAIAEEQGFY